MDISLKNLKLSDNSYGTMPLKQFGTFGVHILRFFKVNLHELITEIYFNFSV
jgi:hypothetical protein